MRGGRPAMGATAYFVSYRRRFATCAAVVRETVSGGASVRAPSFEGRTVRNGPALAQPRSVLLELCGRNVPGARPFRARRRNTSRTQRLRATHRKRGVDASLALAPLAGRRPRKCRGRPPRKTAVCAHTDPQAVGRIRALRASAPAAACRRRPRHINPRSANDQGSCRPQPESHAAGPRRSAALFRDHTVWLSIMTSSGAMQALRLRPTLLVGAHALPGPSTHKAPSGRG